MADTRVNVEHYNTGKIETIDFIADRMTPDQFRAYVLGNIIKYASRAQHKGQFESDLEKIRNYAVILQEYESKENLYTRIARQTGDAIAKAFDQQVLRDQTPHAVQDYVVFTTPDASGEFYWNEDGLMHRPKGATRFEPVEDDLVLTTVTASTKPAVKVGTANVAMARTVGFPIGKVVYSLVKLVPGVVVEDSHGDRWSVTEDGAYELHMLGATAVVFDYTDLEEIEYADEHYGPYKVVSYA